MGDNAKPLKFLKYIHTINKMVCKYIPSDVEKMVSRNLRSHRWNLKYYEVLIVYDCLRYIKRIG